jgi:hypothetical protein
VQILCACGCGELIWKYNKYNKKRTYKVFHGLRGFKQSEETKEKLRRLYLGKTYDEIYGKEKAKKIIKKMVKSHTGLKWSEEDKKNWSNKLKGISLEERYGKKQADIFRKISSKTHTGQKVSNHHKLKLSKLFKGKSLESRYGKEFAQDMIRRANEKKIGNKSHLWKGGVSFEPYDKQFNKRFKKLIRTRDEFICAKCEMYFGENKKFIVVHHINGNKKNTLLQNCISLCRICHCEVHQSKQWNQWIKFFHSILAEKYGYVYDDEENIVVSLEKTT